LIERPLIKYPNEVVVEFFSPAAIMGTEKILYLLPDGIPYTLLFEQVCRNWTVYCSEWCREVTNGEFLLGKHEENSTSRDDEKMVRSYDAMMTLTQICSQN
jgi:hypothetical protein